MKEQLIENKRIHDARNTQNSNSLYRLDNKQKNL